jgi:hypothetical protein
VARTVACLVSAELGAGRVPVEELREGISGLECGAGASEGEIAPTDEAGAVSGSHAVNCCWITLLREVVIGTSAIRGKAGI